MTILNSDELAAAFKWKFPMSKTATRTTVAISPFSVFDLAGQPGAGTLAITNTANGLSQTKAIAGYPTFPDATAGKGMYLAVSDGQSSVACGREVYDFIYSQGANAFNASQAITAQPNIDDRLRLAPAHAVSTPFRAGDLATSGTSPIKLYLCTVGGITGAASAPNTTAASIADGTVTWRYIGNGLSYAGLELFVEQVTAGTGIQSVNVTYSSMADDGVTLTAGKSTGTVAMPAAMIVGRMQRLPLQAGDKNIALITNVVGSVATVGTFNLHLARKLDTNASFTAPFTDLHGYDRTGLLYVPNNAALREVQTTSGTVSATFPLSLTLAMG